MQNPFLNQNQREKFYHQISLYKKNNINNTTNDKKEIISNKENKKEIKIDLNKEKKKMMSEVGCDADITIKKEKPKIKVDNSCNFSVNNSTLLINCTEEELLRCWHCLKPLKKEKRVVKEKHL